MNTTALQGRIPSRLATLAAAMVMAGCAVSPVTLAPPQTLQAALADRDTLAAAQAPVNAPIGLGEAIARAIKFNRDRRVQMMETALASGQLDLQRFDMLPALAGSAGYSHRNNLAASSSGTQVNGDIVRGDPPTYSVSADRNSNTGNLALTWNVLDFGLSYVRANQQADRVLIAAERERKAVNNLVQDVRSAYWRAVSAQRLLQRVVPLHRRVDLALADSRQIEALRLKSPLEALTYQRDLLDNRRALEGLQRELQDARIALATLIGLPPGMPLTLQDGGDAVLRVPQAKVEVQALERSALARRPELMEVRYQERITHADGRAALLALLPGLNLNLGAHRDSNDYLLHNDWRDHGAALSFNLFNLFKLPQVNRIKESQQALAGERRLALTAAVLGQVHVSRVAYDESVRQFRTASEYLAVVRRIREQAELLRAANRGGELQLIREELGEVLAELRRDVSFAELQQSHGRLFLTAGLDPVPGAAAQADLNGLARAVSERFEQWERGELEEVAAAPLRDRSARLASERPQWLTQGPQALHSLFQTVQMVQALALPGGAQ